MISIKIASCFLVKNFFLKLIKKEKITIKIEIKIKNLIASKGVKILCVEIPNA